MDTEEQSAASLVRFAARVPVSPFGYIVHARCIIAYMRKSTLSGGTSTGTFLQSISFQAICTAHIFWATAHAHLSSLSVQRTSCTLQNMTVFSSSYSVHRLGFKAKPTHYSLADHQGPSSACVGRLTMRFPASSSPSSTRFPIQTPSQPATFLFRLLRVSSQSPDSNGAFLTRSKSAFGTLPLLGSTPGNKKQAPLPFLPPPAIRLDAVPSAIGLPRCISRLATQGL
ncbi:hypothetical protein CDD82_6298 [Ophiocordyceps australis]|uniref:Uncharacterized protein n=1 Tax=Ophiocordyceps australis TaxID=1399860 RepID=A0A2C5XGS6_9HYPO|nr:hypothetical protein CDD82_6298 [Ophiocordyceps australis]